LTGGKFANGAAYAAYSTAVEGTVAKARSQQGDGGKPQENSEEEILTEMVSLADEGALGFKVPDGFTSEFQDKYVAKKCIGQSKQSCFIVEVDAEDQDRALALTIQGQNHTTFY